MFLNLIVALISGIFYMKLILILRNIYLTKFRNSVNKTVSFIVNIIVNVNLKHIQMKTKAYLIFVLFIALSTTSVVAGNTETKSVKEDPEVAIVKDIKLSNEEVKDKNLSEEEIDRMVNRVEEIRKMDKSNLSSEEKSELRKELKELKKEVRKKGYILYIGGSTLLIIILILLLA